MRFSPPTSTRKKPRRSRPNAPIQPGAARSSRRRGGKSDGRITPIRRRSTPVVRRSVLAVLLVASMVLVTASYRGGVVVSNAQLQFLEVFAPIERGLNRAWDPVAGAWNWTGNLFTATREKPKLERENAELRSQLRVANAQAAEADELRPLVHASEQGLYADYDHVAARIVIRGQGSVDTSVVIDKGTADGVSLDDAVVVADGLIGRVIGLTAHHSTVGLILDGQRQPTAKILGSDGGTGVLQVVSTEGGEPVMRIDKVRQAAKVEVGDEVVTAGFTSPTNLRSLYPGDIPIGQVTSVSDNIANEYKIIQVIPYADFGALDRVLVLTKPDAEERQLEIPEIETRRGEENVVEAPKPVVRKPKAKATPEADAATTRSGA